MGKKKKKNQSEFGFVKVNSDTNQLCYLRQITQLSWAYFLIVKA